MKPIKAAPRNAARFSEIIKLHLDALYSTAVRMTQNEMDAEDLVQTTCLKALKSFGQLRDAHKARSWLFRILTNTYINEYRSRARAPEMVELESVDETGAAVDAEYAAWPKTPEDEFFERRLSEEVAAALDRLPSETRLVVWYADVEDFSYAEIAQMLSCSEGTVASRLFRGRNMLKKQLRDYAEKQGILKGDADDVS